MFNMLGEKLKIVSREMKDMKKMQIELLEMKTRMSEVKNILGGTSGRLGITEEKTNEPEDIGIETILNETYRRKKKENNGSGWYGSVDWVPACKTKGRWFDSQSGHMPGLEARSPVGGTQEATTH